MLQIQLEKLTDTDRYLCLNNVDPTPNLSERLHDLWVQGLTAGHISAIQARKTVGIRKTNGKFTKSTSTIFKPGYTYGYALLKIHKLSLEEINAKTLPPARFVSDLSQGLTVRSDKFIAWRYLKDLCKDYASDLVRDSTQALRKLEDFSNNGKV